MNDWRRALDPHSARRAASGGSASARETRNGGEVYRVGSTAHLSALRERLLGREGKEEREPNKEDSSFWCGGVADFGSSSGFSDDHGLADFGSSSGFSDDHGLADFGPSSGFSDDHGLRLLQRLLRRPRRRLLYINIHPITLLAHQPVSQSVSLPPNAHHHSNSGFHRHHAQNDRAPDSVRRGRGREGETGDTRRKNDRRKQQSSKEGERERDTTTWIFSILARLICSQKLVGSKLVADIG
jgi:hypothetical protein